MRFLLYALTFPVSAPVGFAYWTIEKVVQAVEEEYYDEGRIRKQLLELELRYEFGDIDAETFFEHEQQLLDRLEEARHHHGHHEAPGSDPPDDGGGLPLPRA